ncbi:MAG: hypothetical protein IJZ35_00965 [Clostridia bacterium]|nr:hypothetical protein [Clostridia bacterium]
MAKKLKDYKIYRCPYCACEYYDSTARKGRKVGDPMLECPVCNKKSYRNTILEPALISGDKYFGIRFASLYGNLRVSLIIVYAAFLFCILVKRELMLGICLVGVSVALYALYELLRLQHKSKFLKSEAYDNEISRSLKRLEDPAYAAMVIRNQGIDEESVYFFELYNDETEDDNL